MPHGYSINDRQVCRQDNARHVNQRVEAERRAAAQRTQRTQQSRQTQQNKAQQARTRAQTRIERAVNIAKNEAAKGVKETNENDSVRIRDYKFGRENDWNWCSFFANYCYGIGQGVNKTLFGLDDIRVGNTQNVKKQAQAHGYFSNGNSGYKPKVGDLAVWTNKNNSKQGHIGIVTKVNSDGSYEVTEGNKYDQVTVMKYSSQKHSDTDTKTNSFAGFVRMEDYLYDLEMGKIYANLDNDEQSTDLYEKDDQSTFGYLG